MKLCACGDVSDAQGSYCEHVSESTPEPQPGTQPPAPGQTPDAAPTASAKQPDASSPQPSGTRPQRTHTPPQGPADADNPAPNASVESAKRAVGSAARKLRGLSSELSARAAKFAASRQNTEPTVRPVVGPDAEHVSSNDASEPGQQTSPPQTTEPPVQQSNDGSRSTAPSPQASRITSGMNTHGEAPNVDSSTSATTSRVGNPADALPHASAVSASAEDVNETAGRKLGRLVADSASTQPPETAKPANSPSTAQITRTQQRPVVHAHKPQSASDTTVPGSADSRPDGNGLPADTAANVRRLETSAVSQVENGTSSSGPDLEGITTVPKPQRVEETAPAGQTDGAPTSTTPTTPSPSRRDTNVTSQGNKKPFIPALVGYKLIHGGLALGTSLLVFIALLAAGSLAANGHTVAAFAATALVLFARFTLRWWLDPIMVRRATTAEPLRMLCVIAALGALASIAVITTRHLAATLIAGAITGVLAAGLEHSGQRLCTPDSTATLRRTARLWTSGGIATAAALLFMSGIATAHQNIQTTQLVLGVVAAISTLLTLGIALNLRSTSQSTTTAASEQTKQYGLAAFRAATRIIPVRITRSLILTGALGVAVPALAAPLAVPTRGAAGLATITISVIVGLLVGSWLAGLRRVGTYILPVSFLGLIGSTIGCVLTGAFVMQAIWAVFCGLWIGFLTVAAVGQLNAPETTEDTAEQQLQDTFEHARTLAPRSAEAAAPLLALLAAGACAAGLSPQWAAGAVAGVLALLTLGFCVIPDVRRVNSKTPQTIGSAHLTDANGRQLRPSEIARAAAAESTLTARPRPDNDQPTPATSTPAASVPSIVIQDDEEFTTADRRLDRPELVSKVAAATTGGLPIVEKTTDETEQETPRALGWFIAVEGGDGAGKSTVVAALATAIQERSRSEVIVTREPGGTTQGTALRELLLHQNDWSPRAEALLFAADRAQHVHQVIRPALDRDAIVITDRYVDSSIAYQGAGRDLGHDEILALSSWGTMNLSPDLTILLDVDPTVAAKRREADVRRGAPDRMEREDLSFHNRVRTLFLERAEIEPERYLIVDASAGRDVVVDQVLARALPLLGLPAKPIFDHTTSPQRFSSKPRQSADTVPAMGVPVDTPTNLDDGSAWTSAETDAPANRLDESTPQAPPIDRAYVPEDQGQQPASEKSANDDGGEKQTNLRAADVLEPVEVTERTEATEVFGSTSAVATDKATKPAAVTTRTGRHCADPVLVSTNSEDLAVHPAPAHNQDLAAGATPTAITADTAPAGTNPFAVDPSEAAPELTSQSSPNPTVPLSDDQIALRWQTSGGAPNEGQPVEDLAWQHADAGEQQGQAWSSIDDVFGTPAQGATIEFEADEPHGTEVGDTRPLPSARDIVDVRNDADDSRSRRRKFAAAERARRQAEASKLRGDED